MFNDNHERYLLTRLQQLDESLTEGLQKLAPQDEGQVYRGLLPDSTAGQRRVLHDYLSQLRFAIRNFIQSQALQDATAPLSALKMFRVCLTFAQIAVEELRPGYLRGYGELDERSAAAVERLAAQLQSILRRMGEYLISGEGGGASSRLAQLDGTREEIALLRELERTIVEHGLVELRPPLQTLIERVASPVLEIAVVGRVSAGKSSLLNWWLEQPLLPTGVTPVTSVPTRIVRGDPAQATVLNATGRTQVGLDQIARYVTEEGNPENVLEVLEVLVQLPAPRLEAGLCLVDTPGLGSLATAGASQTLEYLPRCDLALLLIEAGGVITREDLDVGRAVLQAGSELVVALSKADRLAPGELEQARTYAIAKFREALDVQLEISPLSTLPQHAGLAADWYARAVAPLLANARERGQVSLKRKIAVLRETVMAVLEARLQHDAGGSRTPAAAHPAGTAGDLSQARAQIAQAREQFLRILARVPRCTEDLLQCAAAALTAVWLEGRQDHLAASSHLESALAEPAIQIADAVSRPFGAVQAALQEALRQNGIEPGVQEALPSPRGRPLFDAAFAGRRTGTARPRGLPRFAPVLRFAARRRVRHALRPAISRQLSLYAQALRVWGLRYLEELSSRFDVLVASREGTRRAGSGAPLSADATGAAQRDLLRLREWPVSMQR